MRHILTAAFVWLLPAAAFADADAILADAAKACAEQDNGVFASEGAVRQIDMTGDGTEDTIVDEALFTCTTAASLYAGSGGSMIGPDLGRRPVCHGAPGSGVMTRKSRRRQGTRKQGSRGPSPGPIAAGCCACTPGGWRPPGRSAGGRSSGPNAQRVCTGPGCSRQNARKSGLACQRAGRRGRIWRGSNPTGRRPENARPSDRRLSPSAPAVPAANVV